ncbi:MAG: aminotransferase class V-fold PLP-dependent enzyme [Verrucomicrobiales bacterium]|nr:aminotransferase class V-fold PLP-dependent enzyme [Verrucomicrobiales bacterium]
MTLEQIQQDESLRQREFPVCRNKIFLAHAAVCPLPTRVANAIATYADGATLDDQEHAVLGTLARETRQRVARLIGAQEEEVALVGPTSLALSFVAGGFPFRRGDNIVIYFDDYPSNVYPWMALANRGIEVRLLNLRELGRIRTVDVLGQVDENTRLVAVASSHFISGWRVDLPALSASLRDRRIALCVDGIQTLGAFPTLAEHADFIAADAHKWLLGPCGAGFLYVGKSWIEALRPMVYGWNNVRCPDFVAREEMVFRSGAQRYEAGSHSMVGLVGLRAALDLILEIGVDAIAADLLRKRDFLANALQERGWAMLSSDAPEAHRGGIISVTRSDLDLPRRHEELAKAGIVTSLRTDRKGRKFLRLSPHFYNTQAELSQALEQF